MVQKHMLKFVVLALMLTSAVGAFAQANMPYSGTRYATDAYPGFDDVAAIHAQVEKKTPRWFSWWNGPKKDNPAEQIEWADFCKAASEFRAARKGYDALVREWPASPEAAKAQEALADLYFEHYLEFEEAFAEYQYLLDYYSSACDYDAIAYRLYETARMMEKEGKRVFFVRFANTVDVRRAYEAVVLRAPGASYAPAVMLKIAGLREDAGEYTEAVQVYENLRNLYALTPEAKTALYNEGRARMKLLREHPYNRSRCEDTVAFLKMALATNPDTASQGDFEAWLTEAVAQLEDEAYQSAKFYDSRTRTKRSAINAYERFLKDYPASRHAEAARARLLKLQEETK